MYKDVERRKRYFRRILKSNIDVAIVAQFYVDDDWPIVVIPESKVDSTAEIETDDGDLIIGDPILDPHLLRIEVKGLQKSFTNEKDWNPSYDEILTYNKKVYDSYETEPKCLWLINKERTYAAIIPKDTKDQWGIKENVYDKNYGTYTTYYTCKPEDMIYVKIPEHYVWNTGKVV